MDSLPDFICIGAQKAGTTWLYEMLAQNPSVWLPPLKEVHFFDLYHADEDGKRRRLQHFDKVATKLEKRKKGKGSMSEGQPEFLRGLMTDDAMSEDWYRRIFSHPDAKNRISGEITPAYLALSEEMIQFVRDFLPKTKFILIVREPQARNLSQLKMAAARSKIEELSDDDWKGFLRRLKNKDRGNYESSIPLWQKYFGPDRLLILPFSQVKHNPATMLRTIETFIGAEPLGDYEALTEQVHKTKEVTVPDWVVEKAAKLAEPQKTFLIDAFGQDFYEQTK